MSTEEKILQYIKEKASINKKSFLSSLLTAIILYFALAYIFPGESPLNRVFLTVPLSLLTGLIVDTLLSYQLGIKFGQISTSIGRFALLRLRFLALLAVPLLLAALLQLFFSPFLKNFSSLTADFVYSLTLFVFSVVYAVYVFPSLFGKFSRARVLEDENIKDIVRETAAYFGLDIAGVLEIPLTGIRAYNAVQVGMIEKRMFIYFLGSWHNDFTYEEIKAVLAHEFAHAKLGHIKRLFLLNFLANGGVMWIFIVFFGLNWFFRFFGYELAGEIKSWALPGKIALVVGFLVLQVILVLVFFWKSRQFEYEADLQAARYAGKANMISALKKLARLNYVPTNKSSLLATHPSVEERIKRIQELG